MYVTLSINENVGMLKYISRNLGLYKKWQRKMHLNLPDEISSKTRKSSCGKPHEAYYLQCNLSQRGTTVLAGGYPSPGGGTSVLVRGYISPGLGYRCSPEGKWDQRLGYPPQKGHGTKDWVPPRRTWAQRLESPSLIQQGTWDQRWGYPAGKDMGPVVGSIMRWRWGTPSPTGVGQTKNITFPHSSDAGGKKWPTKICKNRSSWEIN